jgi:hypothetical protein
MKTLSTSQSSAAVVLIRTFTIALMLSACTDSYLVNPVKPSDASVFSDNSQAWGPETPNFNIEAVLRGEEGFGLVKFRQPNDDKLIIYLNTWVRGLEPNTSYLLQRAVDTNLDGNCTSTAWLTLGMGLQAQAIVTDDTGSGRAELFRSVAAFPVGSTFDIHFRIVNMSTTAVVLESDCYQFTISQ